MKKKVLIITILLIIVAIIAITAITLFMGLKKSDENEKISTGSNWGDTYYAYLKDALNEENPENLKSNYELTAEMKNKKIQFCNAENEENPTMVITYTINNNPYTNVYKIENEDKINKKRYTNETNLKFLYNIEQDKYNWYICEKDGENYIYIPLNKVFENTESNEIIKLQNKEDIVKDENNEEIKISEFDKIFIDPEIENIKQLDFDFNMTEEKLLQEITNNTKDYKKVEDITTDELKQTIYEEVKKIKEKIDTINKINEKNESNNNTTENNSNTNENANTQTENNNVTNNQTQNNSNSTVQTESNTSSQNASSNTSQSTTLKAGNYTLKYGKYVGTDYTDGTDNTVPHGKAIYVIKPDGTYTFSTESGKSNTGTYKIIDLAEYGSYYSGKKGILFNNNGMFAVMKNNSFEEMAGAGSDYVYQED